MKKIQFRSLAPVAMTIALLGGCASSPASTTGTTHDEEIVEAHETAGAEGDTVTRHHGHEAHHHGHQGHGGHQDHRFTDPEHYAKRWNDPARDSWQNPTGIIEAMAIEPGMTVADLGAGTGYFIAHLSKAVGPEGRVIAVDIEQVMLDYIAQAGEREGWTNVDTLLAGADTSSLKPASVDRILTVNTWHHIPNRAQYSAHLATTLKPGGSIWVVDYRLDSPSGPPPEHRLAPEVIISELEAGGLQAELHPMKLERQFVVVARLRGAE
jgi:SAM-dependent methyltransferase